MEMIKFYLPKEVRLLVIIPVSDMRALPQMSSFGYPIVFDATHSVQQPGGLGLTSGGKESLFQHYQELLFQLEFQVCLLKFMKILIKLQVMAQIC